MIKEAKNIDFYTTGRQLSDQDFIRISEWIRKDKQKASSGNKKAAVKRKQLAQYNTIQTGAK